MFDHGLTGTAFPQLEISLEKIRHNAKALVALCAPCGIHVTGVTKVVCGNETIARAMADGGIEMLADSRIENLRRLGSINLPKLLLRLPMISQAQAVVEFADMSLNSELETIKALARAAAVRNKIHKVILMVDLGDLREGIWDRAEMFRTVEHIMPLKGVALVGIGTNLTCFGAVIPTRDNLAMLVELRHAIEEYFKITLEMISGGNSSSIYLVEENTMPEGINHLRLGEAILCGTEAAYGRPIRGTFQDCFRLAAEIIELKEKPSVPVGEIGWDAFRKTPNFVERGIRKRAICAIGKQDMDLENIFPVDPGITILGASGDHLILDVTDSRETYRVGDVASFNLQYAAILRCTTSEYISKRFI